MSEARGPWAYVVAAIEERLALMAPARRLRLAMAEREVRVFARGRPVRVLDAGCGDGLLSLSMAKRNPEWELLGLDRNEGALAGATERARARRLPNARFEPADLEQSLPTAGFGAVLAIECLSEITDDRRALEVLAAGLAPGGLLVVQVPERGWRPVLPGSATTWREQVRQGYDAAELEAGLSALGLEAIAVEPTFHTLVQAAQDVHDRIKRLALPIRLAAFPLLALTVRLERWGLRPGRSSALLATARAPS
ncbi:MAG: methyltransferase domain-containing protein [Solirubrobacterales bacterium]|nr:methyltransferase domain-containing protein [Solirubrobacterales bacterium]